MSAEWIKTAKVGDKVVAFVNKEVPPLPLPGVATIKAGQVLTIRDIKGAVRSSGAFTIGLLFVEIRNASTITNQGMWEFDYDHRCFRPVHPRKTDISVLTALLNTKPADQPVKEEA